MHFFLLIDGKENRQVLPNRYTSQSVFSVLIAEIPVEMRQVNIQICEFLCSKSVALNLILLLAHFRLPQFCGALEL